jgi:hypothetical protein
MSQEDWRRWSFDDVREARHAQQASQARDRYRQELQAQARARTRQQEGVKKAELARLFAKWARKYRIPPDIGYFSKRANPLFPKWRIAQIYRPNATDYAAPGETWITRSGQLRDGNDLSLESFEQYVRARIGRYDYPWPP